jgi:predicted transcriptional regulator
MLTENDVITAVTDYLRKNGYKIVQVSNTRQKGHDIIAEREGLQLFVEAKGETSSKSHTQRFGKPFDSAQVRVHVAEALYKAIATRQRDSKALLAIAFPLTRTHERLVGAVSKVAGQLGIRVFFVRLDKTIKEVD